MTLMTFFSRLGVYIILFYFFAELMHMVPATICSLPFNHCFCFIDTAYLDIFFQVFELRCLFLKKWLTCIGDPPPPFKRCALNIESIRFTFPTVPHCRYNIHIPKLSPCLVKEKSRVQQFMNVDGHFTWGGKKPYSHTMEKKRVY